MQRRAAMSDKTGAETALAGRLQQHPAAPALPPPSHSQAASNSGGVAPMEDDSQDQPDTSGSGSGRSSSSSAAAAAAAGANSRALVPMDTSGDGDEHALVPATASSEADADAVMRSFAINTTAGTIIVQRPRACLRRQL